MSIYLGEGKTTVLSDMQGPAPDGFHVPTINEWDSVYNIWVALGGGSNDAEGFSSALKIPLAGSRSAGNGSQSGAITYGYYWSCEQYSSSYPQYAKALYLYSSGSIRTDNGYYCNTGASIRGFKNNSVTPDSSWTKLYGTSIESGGIFWSEPLGLISLSSNGTNWVTISDKNVGATVVMSGSSYTEDKCGKLFQWGNNYGFPLYGNVTTSATKVNANTYGPGNYYSSDTFITGTSGWDSSNNGNLRGGVSQGTSTKTSTGIKSAYIGSTKAKAVYVGTTLIREPKREDNRANVDVLYSGAGGTIKHGYDSNYGEILLHKSNGDELIIADRNIGANTFGTGSQAYGGYYTFGGGTAPTGYHIPTSNEINTLVSYYNSITGTATSSARDYVLMPYAGTSTSDHEYKGYYWSSTSASNGAYALVISSQFFLGDQKMGKTALFTVRPFKDT